MRTEPMTIFPQSLDRALSWLCKDGPGNAERSVASALSAIEEHRSASACLALALTLTKLGEAGLAARALQLAYVRALDGGNLPVAVCVMLSSANVPEVMGSLKDIAAVFGAGSSRLTAPGARASHAPPPIPAKPAAEKGLVGAALRRAAEAALEKLEAVPRGERTIAPVPLFSSVSAAELELLLGAFEVVVVPEKTVVVTEGDQGDNAFVVVRGDLEVRKQGTSFATLSAGALFGEMALLARAPRYASVVALRPSILLRVSKEALERVAAERPGLAEALAQYCRNRMVDNLSRMANVLLSTAEDERRGLLQRFETRVFETGAALIEEGSEPIGMHLIASGEVSVMKKDEGSALLLATLGVGQVVGEVAVVLRRRATASIVANCPTVTLFLPREKFIELVRESPEVLHRLYLLAVSRDEETSLFLEGEATLASDFQLL
jgi:CRP-like cAMP-binding protein